MVKLSGHSQRLDAALPLIQQLHGLAYWLALDPDADSAKAVHDLGVKLLVRHWTASLPDSAEQFYNECKVQPWYPYAWAVLTPNEPFAANKLPPWYIRLETRLVELFAQDGKECIVNNMGTGNSGHYVPGATWYGAHCYGHPYPLSQRLEHGLRYRSWFPRILNTNPQAKLFITEFGSTQLVVDPDSADLGFHSGSITPQEYWGQGVNPYLFELEQDPYVECAFYFQMGGFADWSSHEGLGFLDSYYTALYPEQRSIPMADIILPPFPTNILYPLAGRHPITNGWQNDEIVYLPGLAELSDGSIQESTKHWGIDCGNTGYSTDGLACWSGSIYRAGPHPSIPGRGTEVILDHDDGIHFAVYDHAAELYVAKDDRVLAGQPIMRTGMSGFATAPHLHFAIGAYVNGKVIWRNPLRKP